MTLFHRALPVAAALTAALTLSGGAHAQGGSPISIGKIASQKVCSLYSDYWGDWLVVECHNNFAALRGRIEAALAESGKVSVSTRGRRYSVTGTVTEVGLSESGGSGRGYAMNTRKAVAGMDVRLTDTATGRIVWGGLITQSTDAGSAISAGGSTATSGAGPQAIYTLLQAKLANATARGILFHIDPLVAVEAERGHVTLNYGGPLLSLGDLLSAPGPGGRPVRFRVTSAMNGAAQADAINVGEFVGPGAPMTFIEPDSPEANGRTIQRVELP